eukprot:gene10285-11187_t
MMPSLLLTRLILQFSWIGSKFLFSSEDLVALISCQRAGDVLSLQNIFFAALFLLLNIALMIAQVWSFTDRIIVLFGVLQVCFLGLLGFFFSKPSMSFAVSLALSLCLSIIQGIICTAHPDISDLLLVLFQSIVFCCNLTQSGIERSESRLKLFLSVLLIECFPWGWSTWTGEPRAFSTFSYSLVFEPEGLLLWLFVYFVYPALCVIVLLDRDSDEKEAEQTNPSCETNEKQFNEPLTVLHRERKDLRGVKSRLFVLSLVAALANYSSMNQSHPTSRGHSSLAVQYQHQAHLAEGISISPLSWKEVIGNEEDKNNNNNIGQRAQTASVEELMIENALLKAEIFYLQQIQQKKSDTESL